MTSDMERQKHSSCKVSSKCSEQDVTESSAIAKEIGKFLKKIGMIEDDSQKINDELVVRALGAISDKVNILENKSRNTAPVLNHLKMILMRLLTRILSLS
jgi:hypothetical protein